MKSRSALLLATITVTTAIATISGCSSPTEPDGAVYMPLAVGNEWIYVREDASYDTVRIVSTFDVDGETWYRDNDNVEYCNRADGLWIRNGGTARRHALHAPHVGDTLVIATAKVLEPGSNELKDQAVYREVVAVDTVASVPAGNFTCAKYVMKTSLGTFVSNEWDLYAAGIGPVHKQVDRSGSSTWQSLVSYRVN